jgi:hypothetical protein
MNNDYKRIMALSLSNMPFNFSSEMFTKQCRFHGIPFSVTKSGACGEYLKKNSIHLSKRMWKKKDTDITATPYGFFTIENCVAFLNKNDFNFKELTEDNAIQYLKNLGYKIYKPTTEYKEL